MTWPFVVYSEGMDGDVVLAHALTTTVYLTSSLSEGGEFVNEEASGKKNKKQI